MYRVNDYSVTLYIVHSGVIQGSGLSDHVLGAKPN